MINLHDLVVLTEDNARLKPHGLDGYNGWWGIVIILPYERTHTDRDGRKRTGTAVRLNIPHKLRPDHMGSFWTWVQNVRPAVSSGGCLHHTTYLVEVDGLGWIDTRSGFRLHRCKSCHELQKVYAGGAR